MSNCAEIFVQLSIQNFGFAEVIVWWPYLALQFIFEKNNNKKL